MSVNGENYRRVQVLLLAVEAHRNTMLQATKLLRIGELTASAFSKAANNADLRLLLAVSELTTEGAK